MLKTIYDQSVTKVNHIEGEIPSASWLVKKTDYDRRISQIENKKPDISDLAKKTDYQVKFK